MHAFEPSRARFESKKADVHTYAHTRDTRNKKTTTATTAAAATAAATPSCHIEHIADGSSGNVARAASSNASARATPPRRERVSSRRDPRYDDDGRRVGEDTSVMSTSNDVVVGVVEYDASPRLAKPARGPVVVGALGVDGAPARRVSGRCDRRGLERLCFEITLASTPGAFWAVVTVGDSKDDARREAIYFLRNHTGVHVLSLIHI